MVRRDAKNRGERDCMRKRVQEDIEEEGRHGWGHSRKAEDKDVNKKTMINKEGGEKPHPRRPALFTGYQLSPKKKRPRFQKSSSSKYIQTTDRKYKTAQ